METRMTRRRFLGTTALAAAAIPAVVNRSLAAETPAKPAAQPFDIPIIDCHIHLYDPTRPQGAPWPNKSNTVLYQPTLPSRYRPIAESVGIVGAIEVECSTWLEDNQWVLDVSEKDDIMVGTVGDLEVGTPDFRKQLERFHANRLFRGIRYGNLWRRNLGEGLNKPEFVADLRALAEADLVLDTANPNVALLADVVRVSDLVPNLRIVVDHLPQMVPPAAGSAERASYDASLKAFRERPQIYVKVSEVLRRVDGKIPTDLEFYRARLDEIYDVFGPDRVLYGSDWPNSDQWLPVPVGFQIVKEYFLGKGRVAAEKYFWRNSTKCYKWVKRRPNQPVA
jgi:predicted TIM-barrel fold metal-dependent hydrolase